LLRRGIVPTTGEVLAIAYEICRDATAAFPQSPDDVWITDRGEVLIARADQPSRGSDPRTGVAAWLEALLPPDGLVGAGYAVSPALRGLPARLRANKKETGPQDRKDLMAILSWHLNADPRATIQQLAARAGVEDTAAIVASAPSADLDSFAATPEPAIRVYQSRTRNRLPIMFAFLAIGGVLLAIGSASYWLSRDARDSVDEPRAGGVVAPADAAVVPTDVSPSTIPPDAVPSSTSAAPPPDAGTAGQAEPLDLEVAEGTFSPTFAASGRELFFHAGRARAGRLLVASVDNRGTVSSVNALRTESARNYHPRVSPDGRWIAFDSDRDGERGVYVANRDGSSLERVSGPGYGAVPSWSPDMKWLAFIRGEPKRPRVWNLWLRNLSTGAMQRHTAFRHGQVWSASWFPDGQSLCYSHDQQLVISHLDGRDDIVIDSPRRGQLVRTPAVSPDGRRVVFQVFRDGVWLLEVPTRSMRKILADPTAEEFAWSPDGRRIVYHSRRDGDWKIWVMSIEP
jgi:Tol biopolymer transport system component